MYIAGTVFFGLLGWLIPFFGINLYLKGKLKIYRITSILSFGFCLAALCLQFADIVQKVNNVNLANLEKLANHTSTILWIAIFLSVTTLLFNIVAFLICRKKQPKQN